MAPTMSTHTPNLWRVLSDAARVIRAHPRHFSALSVLFLFPVSLLNIIYPFLMQPTSKKSHYQPLISSLYTLSVILFSYCASISITFSTFRGLHGKPVSLISSLESIPISFFPLLATRIVTGIILGLVVFGFLCAALVAYNGLELLGIEMDYNSAYFMVFVVFIAVLLVAVFVYLQVEWCLSTAVVVLESRWGFAPLNRSSRLVKGMRGVVLSMIVFSLVLVGPLLIWYSSLIANAGQSGWNIDWVVVVQMVVYAVFTTVLTLYSVAAYTVLFVYCKALHGEFMFQVDEETGGEFVLLPLDDGSNHA